MKTKSAGERFWAKVEKTDHCWTWEGGRVGGYGIFRYYDGMKIMLSIRAHRFSYQDMVGPIPEGLVLDHLCRNTICVNPSHLEPVTIKENVLRGYGTGATFARRSACSKGHEYTPENTKMRGNTRVCVECTRIGRRAYKARLKLRRNSCQDPHEK